MTRKTTTAASASDPADHEVLVSDDDAMLSDERADTLVVAPDHAPDTLPEPREPTPAEAQAIKDHLEIRVSELATFVRAECAKHGMDPRQFAGYVADQLDTMLSAD